MSTADPSPETFIRLPGPVSYEHVALPRPEPITLAPRNERLYAAAPAAAQSALRVLLENWEVHAEGRGYTHSADHADTTELLSFLTDFLNSQSLGLEDDASITPFRTASTAIKKASLRYQKKSVTDELVDTIEPEIPGGIAQALGINNFEYGITNVSLLLSASTVLNALRTRQRELVRGLRPAIVVRSDASGGSEADQRADAVRRGYEEYLEEVMLAVLKNRRRRSET